MPSAAPAGRTIAPTAYMIRRLTIGRDKISAPANTGGNTITKTKYRGHSIRADKESPTKPHEFEQPSDFAPNYLLERHMSHQRDPIAQRPPI